MQYTVIAEREFPILTEPDEIYTEGLIMLAEGNGRLFLGGIKGEYYQSSMWIEIQTKNLPNLSKIDELKYSEMQNIAKNGPHLKKLAKALEFEVISNEIKVDYQPFIGDKIDIY